MHIPCRLYPATTDHDLHFRQIHGACGTPVEYRRWCPRCEARLEADDIRRAFEVAPGEFVELGDRDLATLPLRTTHAVEILDFVDVADVDPLFFERAYYIGPGKDGGRPYALLRTVLLQTGRAAVAQIALRAKESLALIRVVGAKSRSGEATGASPDGDLAGPVPPPAGSAEDRPNATDSGGGAGCLTLELMHYPDEIRDWRDVDGLPGEWPVPARELDVAATLVRSMTGAWRPAAYRDTYADALHEVIAAKVAQRGVLAPPSGASEGRYADLLAALEESVRQAQEARGPGAEAAP